MNDNRKLLLAIFLSILIFLGSNYFFAKPTQVVEIQRKAEAVICVQKPTVLIERSEALALDKRESIENGLVKGSVNLKTGNLDDLTLKNYKETVKANSDDVSLLNPVNTKNGYQLELLYRNLSINDWNVETSAQRSEIILTKDMPDFSIRRHIRLDDHYLIHVHDSITNKKNETILMQPLLSIQRFGEPETSNTSVVHEGVVGILKNKLQEMSFSKIKKAKRCDYQTDSGWIGFTDKYWMSALIFENKADIVVEKQDFGYITTATLETIKIEPNQTVDVQHRLFAGAKELKSLEHIRDVHNIKKFDLAVDFGWFYFLTKPLFKALNWLNALFGNFAFAIIVITLISKLLLFPLALKGHRSMVAMKKIQPKIERLKEKYPEDKIKQHQEIMKLYSTEKVHPMSGCLPLLVQIPIMFCLYKILFISIEMRHAPFFGWIHDLSAPDPTSFFNLFGLLPWDAPSVFAIGIWPILMGITMYLQQKLTPQMTEDPVQRKMMSALPIVFTYMFAAFPVGLVLYWTWSNILSICQQFWFTRYE